MENIVVTGVGAITPLGQTMDETWANLLAGKSGIGRATRYDAEDLSCQVNGEIRGFEPGDHFRQKDASRFDPLIMWSMVATREALKDARLDPETVAKGRAGVITGIGAFGATTIETVVKDYYEKGWLSLRPHQMANAISSTSAGLICLETGFQGFSMNVQTACASATSGAGLAMQLLQSGAYDVIVVTGAEAPLRGAPMGAWCAMAAVAVNFNDDPEQACRPFDEDRDGLVMSELGACIVLETERHAKARGRKPYARIAGYGMSNDAYAPYSPSTDGQVSAIRQALANADIEASDIGYLNAHGTGTYIGDEAEIETLKTVFGEGTKTTKIGATKSMTGHAMGATGALEMGIIAKALKEKILPPNRNMPKPIAEMNWVGGEAERTEDLNYAMSLTFGFGGNNAVIIMEGMD